MPPVPRPELPCVAAGLPAALQRAALEGALPDVDAENCPLLAKPLALFYDLGAWEANLLACKAAFGPGFFHSLALKSNGLAKMLCRAHELGFGAECASIGEVGHAQRLGFSGHQVIYDSPVKTAAELRHALRTGAHVNVDNFEELEVLATLRKQLPNTASDVGLRVNPLVGAGAISALSVSTAEGKFGVPLSQKEEILEAFRRHSWLKCVHVHVGSGGMGLKMLVAGVRAAVELALEINSELGRDQVRILDMGGGMPVNYKSEEWCSEEVPSFQEYANALRAEVPELFPGSEGSPFERVITEFGQSLNAKSGWLASRVEYAKSHADNKGQTVLIHFGADLCLRQCYSGEHRRRIEFYDGKRLVPKEASEDCPVGKVHVAGPLCFQGDQLTKSAEAPRLARGDVVVLREAGANTLSLFSRHCLRQVPAAYGYRTRELPEGGREVSQWVLLRPPEDLEDCSRHWGWSPEFEPFEARC